MQWIWVQQRSACTTAEFLFSNSTQKLHHKEKKLSKSSVYSRRLVHDTHGSHLSHFTWQFSCFTSSHFNWAFQFSPKMTLKLLSVVSLCKPHSSDSGSDSSDCVSVQKATHTSLLRAHTFQPSPGLTLQLMVRLLSALPRQTTVPRLWTESLLSVITHQLPLQNSFLSLRAFQYHSLTLQLLQCFKGRLCRNCRSCNSVLRCVHHFHSFLLDKVPTSPACCYWLEATR